MSGAEFAASVLASGAARRRARRREVADAGGGIGIDTVRLAVDCRLMAVPEDGDTGQLRRARGVDLIVRRRRMPGYGQFEFPELRPGSEAQVWCEASLPKRAGWSSGDKGATSNAVPVSFPAAGGLVRGMVGELVAAGWVRDVSDVRLNRVDVDRDFHGVSDVPALISSLQLVPVPGALRMKPAAWFDRDTKAGVSTWSLYNRAHRATLYDKSAESGLAPGQLRYEYRCRLQKLRDGGVVHLSDLGATLDLAKGVFVGLGWGATVVPVDEMTFRVLNDKVYVDGRLAGKRFRVSLVGWLAAARAGCAPPLCADTRRRYGRALRQLGYVEEADFASSAGSALGVGLAVLEGGVGAGRRLDWDSGLAVAA